MISKHFMFKVHTDDFIIDVPFAAISKHFMFKVHIIYERSCSCYTRISKHFMFKVHLMKALDAILHPIFQNISCLRFMMIKLVKS